MAYSNETYKKAEQELKRRRSKALVERERHHAEAVAKIPEILLAEEKMSKAGLSAIKSLGMKSGDGEKYIADLAKINLEAQKERQKLLVGAGFSEDYLKAKFTCTNCFSFDCFNSLC